jgi:hypothetical protein
MHLTRPLDRLPHPPAADTRHIRSTGLFAAVLSPAALAAWGWRIPFLFILGKPGFAPLLLMQILFDAAIALFSGAGPAAISEMFHTIGRSTWMTPAYALSVAIFGGFAPFIDAWLIGVTGSPLAPAYYVIAATIVSFLVIWQMPETAYRSLRCARRSRSI